MSIYISGPTLEPRLAVVVIGEVEILGDVAMVDLVGVGGLGDCAVDLTSNENCFLSGRLLLVIVWQVMAQALELVAVGYRVAKARFRIRVGLRLTAVLVALPVITCVFVLSKGLVKCRSIAVGGPPSARLLVGLAETRSARVVVGVMANSVTSVVMISI